MSRWVFVFAITSLFGLAPSRAAPDGKAEFLRWVSELARAKKLSVCRAGELRYQGEAPGYFAALGDPKLDAESTPIVLFSNGTKHWSYEENGLTVHAGGTSPPVIWEKLDLLTIHAQDMATKYLWDEEDVTFVEGEPVTLREVHSNIDGDSTTDWLAATVEHTKSDPPSPEGPEEGGNGMLILLPPGSRWLKSWKAPTFVSFGDKNRQGSGDADLAVQALDLGKAGIRIVADVTDDRIVPTPARADAKGLIRSDHLELWWVPVGAQDAKQLGIGMRADGSADVRWLMPSRSTEKLPVVRRTGSHFEIDLSAAALGLDVDALDKHPTLPFTVAFSDTDDPGAKQQTVIATSPVRWNRKETFGELTRLPSNAKRFPTFGGATPPEKSK